jgi:flagellar basal body rod protein FlgB
VGKLEKEAETNLTELRSLVPADENLSYARVGSALIAQRTPILSRATSLLNGFKIPRDMVALPALPIDGRVPHTKGKVSPSGVADLLVVKQTLKGYQAADIAHVENVLKGESKQRKHTKTTRTETLVSSEEETNTNAEHELISTTRFEMSKESANTIKEDQQLKGDLKVSAKYGPAVSIDASVSGSIGRNKEEIKKAASKYGQDVTDRTVKKITERTLEKQSTTTIVSISCRDRP